MINIQDIDVLQLLGIIVTSVTIIGAIYKGMKWLLDEVKKENKAIREEVKQEQKEIKDEAIERIEENKREMKGVEANLSRELNYNTSTINSKLETISNVIKDNKSQLEGYAKNIAKTVERNNYNVNEHETRISVLETKIQSAFDTGSSRTKKDSQLGKHLNKHSFDNNGDSAEQNDGDNQ